MFVCGLGGGVLSYIHCFVDIDSIAQIDGSLDLSKDFTSLPVIPILFLVVHTVLHLGDSGYLDHNYMSD